MDFEMAMYNVSVLAHQLTREYEAWSSRIYLKPRLSKITFHVKTFKHVHDGVWVELPLNLVENVHALG